MVRAQRIDPDHDDVGVAKLAPTTAGHDRDQEQNLDECTQNDGKMSDRASGSQAQSEEQDERHGVC
jgi:hypothetical protein